MYAIVIGNNHYNTLGVIRSLGEKKIPIIAVFTTLQKNFVEKSKYIHKTYHINEDEETIINTIKNICDDKTNYYIIPTTDYSSEVLDKNYLLFANNITIPNMKGKMGEAQNKQKMRMLAEKSGLLISKGSICNLENIGSFLKEWDSYPAIIKPLLSKEGQKSDIVIVSNEDLLKISLNEFQNKGYSRVIVEEYIAGDDEYMVEVMGYCSGSGKPFIGGVIKKIREFPIQNGSTSFAEIIYENHRLDFFAIDKFLKNYSYSGLFDMEFKYANGKSYFIECNYRNGAPSYALTQRNINLPYLWIANEDNKENHPASINSYFMSEHLDFINLLKKDVNFSVWVKDYMKSTKLLFQFKDIKPSLIYYYDFLIGYVKKLL